MKKDNGIFCWLGKVRTLLTLMVMIGGGFTFVILCYASTEERLNNLKEELSEVKVNETAEHIKGENNTRAIISLQRDVEYIRATQDNMYKESKAAWEQILARLKQSNGVRS